MSKSKAQKIKIWYILNDGLGYWTENPDWIWEFKEMNDRDKFTIECRELTKKEFNKLVKISSEFDGW